MKYALGFALLLGSWLQPLHVLPWVSWHSETLAFAAVAWLFLLAMFDQKKRRHQFFVMPTAAVVPLAMALLVLIQYGLGLIHFFGDALSICFYFATCSMAIAVGGTWVARDLHAGRTPASMPLLGQLAAVVLLGAIVSVFIALIQAFNVWDSADWIVRSQGFRRPGSNIGQPNLFATLVLMGLASLVFLFESNRLSAPLATVLLVLLALGLAVSESRTGLLSAAVLSAWGISKGRAINFKLTATPVLAGWGILVFLVWAWPLFITYVHYGVDSGIFRTAGIDTSAGLRLVVWPQLIEAALQRPWFGWGLRQVSEAHNAVLHHYWQGEPFTYAHNVVLDLAIGVGLPMTALLVGWLGYWIWCRMYAASTLVPWYCIALAIPLSVHSMLEFPFAYAYFLVPAMLAVGVLEANVAPHAILSWRWSFTILGTASLFFLMSWSVMEYVAIEEDFRIARFEALHVGHTPIEYKQPNSKLLTQLEVMLIATRTVPSPNMSASEIELLRNAAMRFPWTAIQNRYALSLALNGSPDESIRQLKVMRAMYGEKTYEGIRANWEALAEAKYPQLKLMKLP